MSDERTCVNCGEPIILGEPQPSIGALLGYPGRRTNWEWPQWEHVNPAHPNRRCCRTTMAWPLHVEGENQHG